MTETLLLVKPDAVSRSLTGEILSRLELAGFRITGLRMLQLTEERAREFYAVHEGKPFLTDLVEYMSSGPIVAVKLIRDDAIEKLREVIGATDPTKAEQGTIRREFAVSMTKNSVHASDAPETAETEIAFFFGPNPRA
jgi:nucleoside-diphosphate kinase